jgi:ABC-type Na+ efflux pump, permease component
MFILMFGGMVQRSVIEEKNSRVVEVIVSSVRSVDLMIGKIIGVALVALTQFLIWIAFTVVLLFAFQSIVGVNFLKQGAAAQAQMSMPQASFNAAPGDTSTVALADAASGSKTDLGASITKQLSDPNSDMSGIVSGIKAVNFPYVLLCFLLYFIFGYLLYASMFAAVGSAVDNETDTNQLQIPITAPLIIGLFVMLQTFQHPDSPLSVWCSMIPWTSPMVMLARIPFGTVPVWQLALSLVLLALTFIGTAWLSGKIYRVGILSYGKKATWADMFKWIKYKK